MDANDKYLVLLRRELTQAQARLRRAERERDQAVAENIKLRSRDAEAKPAQKGSERADPLLRAKRPPSRKRRGG